MEHVPLLRKPKYSIGLICRVLLAYLSCVLCSGPLTSFPTLQPLFVSSGTFSYFCSEGETKCTVQNTILSTIYTVSVGLSFGCFFIAGYFYDAFGARTAAVVGAFSVSLSLYLIALSTSTEALNWMLFLAFPLGDFSGLLNSVALYGFMWHFPHNHGFIIGLSNSSYQLSGLLGGIISLLVKRADFSLPIAFALISLASLFGCFLALVCLPSLGEYNEMAEKQLGFVNTSGKKSTLLESWKKLMKLLNKNFWEHFLAILAILCAWILVFYVVAILFPFYTVLFIETPAAADDLAELFSYIYAVLGVVGAPFLGILIDFVGLKAYWSVQQMILTCSMCIIWIPSFSVQILFMFGFLLVLTSLPNYLDRWVLLYSTPDLVGLFVSLIVGLGGISQLVINLVLPLMFKQIFSTAWQYYLPFIILTCASILTSILHLFLLFRLPPPLVPPISV